MTDLGSRCYFARDGAHGGDISMGAEVAGLSLDQVLDFSANINPHGPPEAILSAALEALGRVSSYPPIDSRGAEAAMARSIGVDPGQVCLTAGATSAIYSIFAYLRPAAVLVIEPNFTEYRRAAGACGATVIDEILEAPGFEVEAQRLAGRVGSGDLVVLSNPNNPTGRSYPAADVVGLAEAVHPAILLVDEAFVDFDLSRPSVVSSVSKLGNVVVIRSLTKMFAIPGIRSGYLVGPEEWIGDLKRERLPWPMGHIELAVTRAASESGQFVTESARAISEARRDLAAELSTVGLTVHDAAANYLLVNVAPMVSCAITRKLMGRGIMVRDCCGFRGLGRDYLRIAVRTREENARLIKELALIAEAELGGAESLVGEEASR